MTIFATGFLTNLALVVAVGAQTLFLLRQVVRRDRVLLSLGICLAGDAILLFAGVAGVGVVADAVPWLIPAMTVAGIAYLLWFAAGALKSAWKGQTTLSSAAAEAQETDPEHAPSLTDVVNLTGQLPVIDEEMLAAYRAGHLAEDVPASPAPRSGEPAESAPPSIALPSGSGSVAVQAKPKVRTVALEVPQTPLGKAIMLALSVSLLNPHAILDMVVMLGTVAQAYGEDRWLFSGGAILASALWIVLLGWGGTKLAPLMNSARMWRIVDTVVGVLMLGIAVKIGLTLF
ncbi:LysE/ArgO family amino acid transporter [Micrococcus luteus]